MKIEAVLFDLDETLHARAPSVARFARRLHAEASVDAPVEDFVAMVLRRDQRGRRPTEGLYTWLATHFDLGKTAAEVVDAYRTTAWDRPVLYPDARETLRRLRPLKLGIVTNGSRASQATKIANGGLDRLTDATVISGVLGVAKPHRGIFDAACAELGVPPTRCAMVGDSPEHDVAGGKAAGMRTIWVARGPWPKDRAREHDAAVHRLAEVVAIIRQWA